MENKTVINIFDYKLGHSENIENAFKFLSDEYLLSEEKEQRLKDKLKKLLSKFRTLYQKANRTRERFEANSSGWLHSRFCIEEFIKDDNNVSVTASAGKRGRPRSSFLSSSERSKRRNINDEILDPKVDSIEKALHCRRSSRKPT